MARKQFCPRNHDTFVTGRDDNNYCLECKYLHSREFHAKHRDEEIRKSAEWRKEHKEEVIENNRVYHLEHQDELNAKAREYARDHQEERKEYMVGYRIENSDAIKEQHEKYLEEHEEEIQKWYDEHRDKINAKQREKNSTPEGKAKKRLYYLANKEEIEAYKKQWAKDHPESTKISSLKAKTNRGLRVVPWGRDGLKEFYLNMPDYMSEDHIIPLCGDEVSGLHVRWNLQYLPLIDNIKKGNKCTPEEATKHYERILIEAGLK